MTHVVSGASKLVPTAKTQRRIIMTFFKKPLAKATLALALVGLCLNPSFIEAVKAAGKRLTLKQRNQLFIEGKITNADGKIVNIKIVPGIRGTNRIARNAYEKAFDAYDSYISARYYKSMGREIKKGAVFVKDGFVEMGQDDVYEFFLKGIGKDWAARMGEARDASFLLPLVWTWKLTEATGQTLLRTAVLPIRIAWRVVKVALGAGYTVAAPGVMMVVPAIYGTGALAYGTAVIPVLYTWSGTAWVLIIGSKEPTKDSRWVEITNPDGPNFHVALTAANDFMELSMVKVLPEAKQERMRLSIEANKQQGLFTDYISDVKGPLSVTDLYLLISRTYSDLGENVAPATAGEAASLAYRNIQVFAQ